LSAEVQALVGHAAEPHATVSSGSTTTC